MLHEFHKNWIRDALVFEWILSAIVQQFLACNSGGRIEIWLQSRSQIKLNFLQLLDNLVKHISTKFRGIWICTLGDMYFLWRVQNLPEKWQLLDLFGVTLIERSSSWKYVYKCLRYLNLVLRWSRSITSKEYKAIWLWSVLCTHLVLKLEDQDQTQDEV